MFKIYNFPTFFLVFFYFPEILDEHEWVFNMNGGIKIIKTSWTLGLVTLKHDHYEGFFICLNHTEKKQPEWDVESWLDKHGWHMLTSYGFSVGGFPFKMPQLLGMIFFFGPVQVPENGAARLICWDFPCVGSTGP